MKPQHSWLDALESDRRVPDHALQVAAVIARYADNPDDTWVTFRRLLFHTHQHRNKLSKSMGWLRDNGWLKVIAEGRGKRTHYRVTVPVGSESGTDGQTTSQIESGMSGQTAPDDETGRDGQTIVGMDGQTTGGMSGQTTNVPDIEGKRSSARGARAGSSSAGEQIIQTRLGCTGDEAADVLAAIKAARPNIMSPAAVLPRFGDDELRGYLDDVRAKRAARAEVKRRKANATCKTCDDRGFVATSAGCTERCHCRPQPAVEDEGTHLHD